MRKVVVLGGGGYVGSVLCPTLVGRGIATVAYDAFWFGMDTLPSSVWKVHGDIRDVAHLKRHLIGADAVIHLACISNDPSFDLEPEIGRSINWDCFPAICEAVRDAGVERFIYASSSSVYGVQNGRMTEDVKCHPLTDYSKLKLKCEQFLKDFDFRNTCWTILRPATVCGYSPRLRLDLIVNALTMTALTQKKIFVHGGDQLRPNIHIQDMVEAYCALLFADKGYVHQQTFNVGTVNSSILQLAELVKAALEDQDLTLEVSPSVDKRSYHIDSSKIDRFIDFRARRPIGEAVRDLARAWQEQKFNPENSIHYNVKRLKEIFK